MAPTYALSSLAQDETGCTTGAQRRLPLPHVQHRDLLVGRRGCVVGEEQPLARQSVFGCDPTMTNSRFEDTDNPSSRRTARLDPSPADILRS